MKNLYERVKNELNHKEEETKIHPRIKAFYGKFQDFYDWLVKLPDETDTQYTEYLRSRNDR